MCQVGTSHEHAREFTAIVQQHDQHPEEAYAIGGRDIPVAVAAAHPLPGPGLSDAFDDGAAAAPARHHSRALLVAESTPPTAASVVVNAVPVLWHGPTHTL